jgi:hypothetical protein
MSSWSGGRVHFRERKMPTPKDIPQINIPNSEIKTEEQINEYPSKYFIPNHNIKSNDVVICAIALNEELYIDEWIQYNLFLGFSHIYIYDNSDNNSLKDKKTDRVTIIHFPGKTKQLEAYTIFSLQYKNKHKWAAFIDCDEFIVLKKHNSIIDLLNDYDSYDSICLNWKMFGTSNYVNYTNEPVTKRFKYCSATIDKHIKSIIKISSIRTFVDPHNANLIKGHNYDTRKNIIYGSFNNLGDDKIACIHHYYTKSEEEFRQKIERGRSDISQKRSLDELIDIHSNNNDVYNSDAWDFYSKHLEQKPS